MKMYNNININQYIYKYIKLSKYIEHLIVSRCCGASLLYLKKAMGHLSFASDTPAYNQYKMKQSGHNVIQYYCVMLPVN